MDTKTTTNTKPEGVEELASQSTAVAVREAFSLVPKSLTEAMQYAKLIAASELCPKEYRSKPADIVIAMEMGSHFGLSPMQALQSIAVINGRPVMWGDAVLGIVMNSPLFESIEERKPDEALAEGEGRCTVTRKGQAPITRTFSMVEANTAGLVQRSGTTGTWHNYPGRMLQMRARSWALRDAFPDVLKGIAIREEAEDYKDITPVASSTVMMPRRASEAPADVDGFLKETGGNGGAHPQGHGSAPRGTTSDTWQGTLARIDEKAGETKGRKWTLYTAHATDGSKFGTFDAGMANALQMFVGTGELISVKYTMDDRGAKRAVEVSAAQQDDAE